VTGPAKSAHAPYVAALRWAERALNVSPGDLGKGALLCAYLFLVISSYVIGKVARDALFLARFPARELPYADMAIALLVGAVVAAYVRVSRHTSVRNLLAGSMIVFSANCALFWLLVHLYHLPWLYPAFYIWVGIFGVLAPAQVWTLANYVLTSREARRVFGIVGSGAIMGWIFAGFFTKQMVRRFGTESLLVTMAVLLAISAVLVVLIWRRAGAAAARQVEAENGSTEPQNLRQSITLIASSPYLRSIAAVIFLSSLVTTVAGWQFKAIAKDFMPTKDALAIFFGDFNFYAGILSLMVQVLLTSRVLRRFGLGPALFTVPVALLAGSIGLALTATLAAAILLKGADQVLRYSIDKSSVELLYLPLPPGVKIQVKWFIDTVVWRGGDGAAAVLLLALATYLHLGPAAIGWAVSGLILAWFVAAYLARHRYVATLHSSIQQHRLELERASTAVLDRTTTEMLADKLRAPDAAEVLYALRVLEVERHKVPHPSVRALLSHPSGEVRHRALAILAQARDRAVLPQAEALLADPELEVRTEALLFLAKESRIDPLARIEELGDFGDVSIRAAAAAFLGHPGEAQNVVAAQQMLAVMARDPDRQSRREAAKVLGTLPDLFDPLLAGLVADADPEVAREAIQAARILRKLDLAPSLVDCLSDPALAGDASEALVAFGDNVTATVRDCLADGSTPLAIRRALPAIIAAIGAPESAAVLESHLMESDPVLRFHVISGLAGLRRRCPDLPLDTALVESVFAAEIMGNYRSWQIVATLDAAADTLVRGTLEETIAHEQERIFGLLSVLYPQQDFQSAYHGLRSSNTSVHDNALEFLDNILKPQLRQLLVPLLDGQVMPAQRARIAARLVHVNIDTPEEAVLTLITSDDPWLRSCGAYAAGIFQFRSLESHLDRCLEDSDPLLRQTAIEAKRRLQGRAIATGS
jgi:ATP:ADP antiporter, AAA family